MKLFMATLGTETNTFSPIPTARSGFADTLPHLDRDATSQPPNLFTETMHVWPRRPARTGWCRVGGNRARAPPAGRIRSGATAGVAPGV